MRWQLPMTRNRGLKLLGCAGERGEGELPQDSLPVTRVNGRCGRTKHAGRRTLLTCWSHFPSAEVVMMAHTNKGQDSTKKDRQSKR